MECTRRQIRICKRWENGYDCKRINAGKRHIQGYKRGCCGKWSSDTARKPAEWLFFDLSMVNGARLFIDYQDYKAAPNDIEIDSEFISYLAPKTLVMAGSSITVEKDVTPEILREKEVKLFAGDCINCYKHVASYIKAHAYVRNKVNVLPDDNNG